MDSSDFLKHRIIIPKGSHGNVKTICPACTPHDRKPENKNAKDLSVEVDEGTWKCWNCGWTGSVKARVYARPEPVVNRELSKEAERWFASRKISRETLDHFLIRTSTTFFPQTSSYNTCVVFPYYENGQLVNEKYRDAKKNFRMVKDAKLLFFNIDSLKGVKAAVITEGEIDAMSVYEAGYEGGIVSVPNGGTEKGALNLEYLDNCWDAFEHLDVIIIATDGDVTGKRLRDELARRLGKHRCRYVVYPEGSKDFNECAKNNVDVLKLIVDALPFPVDGVVSLSDVESEVDKIHEEGVDPGQDLGFPTMDQHLRFRRGELYTITGIPNSGKSVFVDQIANRLAARHGWKVAFCSPEKSPVAIHMGVLMGQFVGTDFFAKDPIYRMHPDDYAAAKHYVNEHFKFFLFSEVDQTVQGVVSKATELVKSFGLDMLVVDPWNYLEHQIPHGMSETQYINKALDHFLRFAKMYGVLVILVAHPIKINKEGGKYIVPTLYNISGSAHFFNKTDNGGCVYRHYETGLVSFFIQKVRNDFVGSLGEVVFKFDRKSRNYAEENQPFKPIYELYYQRLRGQ